MSERRVSRSWPKSEIAYSVMKRKFKDREVFKEYHALVQGEMAPPSGTNRCNRSVVTLVRPGNSLLTKAQRRYTL